MEWGVKTHIGKVRDKNEDSYFCQNEGPKIFIVADGMGGHNAGEIASKIAIETVSEYLNQYFLHNNKFTSEALEEAINIANKRIFDKSQTLEELDGMGTTITVSLIDNNTLYIGHIGDSRAYILRDDKLIQLTQDHTLVSELVKNGTISEIEAIKHPKRNIITKALGTEEFIEPDILKLDIINNDIIILCTDGLTNAVSNEEIKDIFLKSGNLQRNCEALVELANNRGGHDNITVLALRYMDV